MEKTPHVIRAARSGNGTVDVSREKVHGPCCRCRESRSLGVNETASAVRHRKALFADDIGGG